MYFYVYKTKSLRHKNVQIYFPVVPWTAVYSGEFIFQSQAYTVLLDYMLFLILIYLLQELSMKGTVLYGPEDKMQLLNSSNFQASNTIPNVSFMVFLKHPHFRSTNLFLDNIC